MPANWENSSDHRAGKGQFSLQCQRMFKLPSSCALFTCSQSYTQNLQARLQQYMNQEPADVQLGFRKGRGTGDQTAKVQWIIEKAREFWKNIYFCFTDYAKGSDCGEKVETGIDFPFLGSKITEGKWLQS